MQRLSGVLLGLAGIALGGYVVMPEHLVTAGPTAISVATATGSARNLLTGSLSTPAVAEPAAVPAVQPAVRGQAGLANGTRVFSPAAPLAPAVPGATTSTWSTVVSTESSAQAKLTSSKPTDAETRASLASDLQRELKRVGCYGGEINGAWTPSSKQAMSTFMERVNATLPIDEPDYILLTLVQGHSAIACGVDCPSGQVMSDSGATAGRCLPQSVVAQATRKSKADDDRRLAEARKSEAQQQRAADAERVKLAQKDAEAQRKAEAKAQQARMAELQSLADAQRAADLRAQARKATLAAETQRLAAVAASQRLAAEKAKAAAAQASATRSAAAVAVVVATAPKKTLQTAAVAPEPLPWLAQYTSQASPRADTSPSTLAAAPANARANRPDGMMSIGGPRIVTLEKPARLAAVTPNKGPQPLYDDLSNTAPQSGGAVDAVAPAAAVPSPETSPESSTGTASGRAAIPSRQSAIQGLPGAKSGRAIQGLPGAKSGRAIQGAAGTKAGRSVRRSIVQGAPHRKYRPARIVRRPSAPVYVYAKPKKIYYAAYGKSRRYQPRPHTRHYNLMLSLGGVY